MNQNNPYMNQGTPYQKYGYDQFEQSQEQAATSSRKRGLTEKIFGQRLSMKFKNPLFATAALLLAGSAFATVIVMSYPKGDGAQDVPVVKAETMAFKEVPTDPGGMEIPFQDSTIFSAVREGTLDESAPVENLLAEEEPVDRFANFAKEAEEALKEEAPAMEAMAMDVAETTPAAGEEAVAEATTTPEAAPLEIKKIVQKTEKVSGQEIAEATNTDAADSARRPHKLHAPGSSPETLAFVRSVLDKKDAKGTTTPSSTYTADASAASVAAIEPAAGAAVGANIQPGNYFVQLASVTSSAGAAGEWGKLQKKYTAQLSQVAYRVQEANLGERGTYYRIQAGPMSKESANEMCDAIKVQKPGACLVVK